MRVAVKITLDVDQDAWAQTYGIPKAEVREDVQRHVKATVWGHLEDLGGLLLEADRG